jgi:hypothetical protein
VNGLDGCRESLSAHWSSLSANWDRLAALWDDAVREDFEENHWREFEASVPPVLEALERLHEVVSDALRVVDSLD